MASNNSSHFIAKFDTNFFERYARLTLIAKLGEDYANLFNADRPDLQTEDKGFGVEVTRAIDEDKSVAKELINEMAGKRIKASASKEHDALESVESGYAYGLTDTWIGEREYDYWMLALPMRRIVASKVEKVAKGFYGEFKKYGLYVFTIQNQTEVDIEALIHYTIELQKHNKMHYDVLFISQIDRLFVCDLTCGAYQSYNISRAESREFYAKSLYNRG